MKITDHFHLFKGDSLHIWWLLNTFFVLLHHLTYYTYIVLNENTLLIILSGMCNF